MLRASAIGVLCLLLASSLAHGQQKFSELVGDVTARPVRSQSPIEIPYITWGGDVATFHANGGLTTKSGTIYDQLGLQMKLTAGDDFVTQVKNYVSGKTPFLRGTFRMLGQASEVLSSDLSTKPVVIMQLSWSAGDHIVSRESIQQLNDLRAKNGKKVRIACQQGGPHVGLLYDSLKAVSLTRDDVEIIWVDDLTGPKGAAERFRSDETIDACCVITPDMLSLTGEDGVGTGAEGTVKGARVLNSTRDMSRSIADVYAVRSDWYKQNKPFVQKFVAGYLKAAKEVVAMRTGFEQSERLQPNYKTLLTSAQSILGKDVLPTLEVDAHGLLLDCTFVGLPGQLSFFEDAGNLEGFNSKMNNALDLATSWGYAKGKFGFDPSGLDYRSVSKASGLPYPKTIVREDIFAGAEVENFEGGELDENTILSFTINFGVNDSNFAAARFGAEFQRAIQSASTFGNAVVMIRGHADPTLALREFVRGGKAKRTLRITGQPGNFRYWLKDGRQLDLTQTEEIVKLIQTGAFETKDNQPMRIVQAALNLSKVRADKVKDEIVKFAKAQGVNLDASQLKPVGAGISDPIVPRPINREQAAENRRVEFRIVRVNPETLGDDAFDF